LINIVTLFDRIGGVGIVPGRLQEELAITIGVGHGYMQFSSSNIISMFVIAPYLLCLQFRADADGPNSLLTKVSLIMSLVFVALSGRRTLWLAVVLTPCMILFLSSVTGNVRLMKAGVRRMLFVCVTLTVLGLGSLIVTSGSGEEAAAIKGIQQALSSEDERTYQAPYLIDGYLQSPVFGAGFGANAGIVRSEESPWMYELTYHQLLFNIGSFGVAVLGTLMSLYLAKVILLLRQFKDQSAVPFALVIALLCLLLGAYSNPYLAGFDSIFFVGMLPYLSTFRCGFTSSISSRTESLAPCL
jgi:hypothetical protein